MGSIVPVQLWLQRFVASLLLFAVGSTAAVGLVAGYRCDCDSAPRVVSTPQCDGESCHPGRAHADGCADLDAEHSHDGAEHSHDHTVIRQKADWAGARQDWSKPLEVPPAISVPVGHDSFLPKMESVGTLRPEVAASPPFRRLAFLTSVLLI